MPLKCATEVWSRSSRWALERGIARASDRAYAAAMSKLLTSLAKIASLRMYQFLMKRLSKTWSTGHGQSTIRQRL